jgi:hypothetical protein
VSRFAGSSSWVGGTKGGLGVKEGESEGEPLEGVFVRLSGVRLSWVSLASVLASGIGAVRLSGVRTR